MAIAYVGSSIVEASSGASSQTVNTMTVPAGTVNGSVGVVFLFANEPTSGLVVPNNWTLIKGPVTTTGVGTAEQSWAWWVPLNAANAGSQVSITDGINGSRKSVSALLVFSGADQTAPVVASNGVASNTSTGSRTTPQLTGAPAGACLVEAVSDRVSANTGAWTVPGGMTSAGQNNSDSLVSAVAAYGLNATGTVGAHTYTKTVTAPQAHAWSVVLATAAGPTGRPNGTVINAGNYVNIGGAASLEAALADESDATYAESPDNPAGTTAAWTFPSIADGAVTVKVRHQASAASPAITRKYDLMQGGSVVVATRSVTLPTAWTDYQFTTTSAETAKITDRSQLRVRITDTTA